jgi:lipopolysaccharide export system ATP-binding protein
MSKVQMLEAVKLRKRYHDKTIVSDVSMQVPRGKIIGLLGPNGAGKTTCFHMIVGVEIADGGVLKMAGKDITTLPIHERVRLGLGYLPQEPSVFRSLSVEDNLLAVLEVHAQIDRKEQQSQARQLLKEFGLSSLRKNKARVLSGGERRRLEIARTLALEPNFVLLDEPFAGVDPIALDGVRQLVCNLRDRNIGVLITDHNVQEALTLCDYAYVLHDGGMCAEGTSKQIIKNPKVQAVYLGERFQSA